MEDSTYARLAALASLAAIRATVSGIDPTRANSVLLLPDLRPLSKDAAVAELSRRQKPVACIGLETRGTLVVGVWDASGGTIDNPDALEIVRAAFRDSAATIRTSISAEVAIRGSVHDRVTMTFAQAERWLTEYAFPLLDMRVTPALADGTVPSALCTVEFLTPAGGWLESS